MYPGADAQERTSSAVGWLAKCAADSLVGVAETSGESWTRVQPD